MLQQKLYDLTAEYVNTLKALPHRPDGWLPHIVYVEEEGYNYPVFIRYRMTELRNDGSCTLIDDETGEMFTDRDLTEINIEWLDTLLNRYIECCKEQGLNTPNE